MNVIETSMKRFQLIYLFSFFAIVSHAQNEEKCEVSTQGIYYAQLDSVSHIYIRFSDKDTVYTTSSESDFDLVSKYIISKNKEHLMVGKYAVNSNRCMVSLKAKNDYGKVKMEGIISGDKLVLTVVNKKDNTARDFAFEFYPDN